MKFDEKAAIEQHCLAVLTDPTSKPDDKAQARARLVRGDDTIDMRWLDNSELDQLHALLAKCLGEPVSERAETVAEIRSARAADVRRAWRRLDELEQACHEAWGGTEGCPACWARQKNRREWAGHVVGAMPDVAAPVAPIDAELAALPPGADERDHVVDAEISAPGARANGDAP